MLRKKLVAEAHEQKRKHARDAARAWSDDEGVIDAHVVVPAALEHHPS